MGYYASDTSVPAERSEAEIRSLLTRYGAQSFMSGHEANRAMVAFRCQGRLVRFILPLPSADDKSLRKSQKNDRTSLERRQQQEIRRRWRALALIVKAKLEAVASKVTSFESEFMAHIVMPDGKTVAEHVSPWIEAGYSNNKVAGLLPEFTEPRS